MLGSISPWHGWLSHDAVGECFTPSHGVPQRGHASSSGPNPLGQFVRAERGLFGDALAEAWEIEVRETPGYDSSGSTVPIDYLWGAPQHTSRTFFGNHLPWNTIFLLPIVSQCR